MDLYELFDRKEQAVVFWSGGKDACLALHFAQNDLTVSHLLTTVEQNFSSSHHLPVTLLEAQALSLGLPLRLVRFDEPPDNLTYEHEVAQALGRLLPEGVTAAVSGDIFLDDVRSYREKIANQAGLQLLTPLWHEPPIGLSKAFIQLGYQAIVVCVNAYMLDTSFVGRPYDAQFIADLPAEVDPCGENGEFHTFVFDGPAFHRPVEFQIGEVYEKLFPMAMQDFGSRYWYADLLPA